MEQCHLNRVTQSLEFSPFPIGILTVKFVDSPSKENSESNEVRLRVEKVHSTLKFIHLP